MDDNHYIYSLIQHLGCILDNRLPLILTLALIEMDIQLMKDTLVELAKRSADGSTGNIRNAITISL